MTAAELWAASGLSGTYETWSFGEAQEELVALVKARVKKATSSAYLCFDVGERDGTGESRQEISGSRQQISRSEEVGETEPDAERLPEELEKLPTEGSYSIILDSRGEAACIVKTTKVEIVPFKDVTEEFAAKEGEDDRSLKHWREVHERFFTKQLAAIGESFDENTLVVCEEFEPVKIAEE